MKLNRDLSSVSILASLVMVLFMVTNMVLLGSHIFAQSNSSSNITSAATNASYLDRKMKQLESSNDQQISQL